MAGHHGDGGRDENAPAAAHLAKRVDQTIGRKKAQLDRAAARMQARQQRIDEKLSRRAAQLERMSARLQSGSEMLDRLSDHLGTLEVWTRVEPGGRRPRFTRDEIAATAVRIADRDGFGAVSMRNLATELGAGTMTLYHYVRTKDELLTLVMDSLMGEVALPPGELLPGDWRDALTVIARRTRDTLLRHPWALDVTADPALGPNSVRHFDQTLQALTCLDVDFTEKLDIVMVVDAYVFGYCTNERSQLQGDHTIDDTLLDYVRDLLATGEYPQLSGLAEQHGVRGSWALLEAYLDDEGRFDRNLDRILDGIEAGLDADATGSVEPDP